MQLISTVFMTLSMIFCKDSYRWSFFYYFATTFSDSNKFLQVFDWTFTFLFVIIWCRENFFFKKKNWSNDSKQRKSNQNVHGFLSIKCEALLYLLKRSFHRNTRFDDISKGGAAIEMNLNTKLCNENYSSPLNRSELISLRALDGDTNST